MNTPYSIIQLPNNFVSNTELQTEINDLSNNLTNDLTNCGAHMTSSGGAGIVTRTSVGSLFQTQSEVQVIAYGDDAPTEKQRTGTGGGFGFQINKTGYYDIYGGFRYGGDYVSVGALMGFHFETSTGSAINVNAATGQRTTAFKWITSTGASGGNNIARINDYVMCGIRMNEGDCVYFVGNPLSGQQVRAYDNSLFFSVKFVTPNSQLIG